MKVSMQLVSSAEKKRYERPLADIQTLGKEDIVRTSGLVEYKTNSWGEFTPNHGNTFIQ